MPIKTKLIQLLAELEQTEGEQLLLAVSKKQPIENIITAYQAGQRHFGENYCQEALGKIQILSDHDITWHFIGLIQSRKIKAIAQNFNWVHSIFDLKTAEKLALARPENLPPLNICIQVNIDNQPSKQGVSLAELPNLARRINPLPHLRLRGLMALPKPCQEQAKQRAVFARVKQALVDINQRFELECDTLSMGTSQDYHAALAEGATIIRIGTQLFGPRDN